MTPQPWVVVALARGLAVVAMGLGVSVTAGGPARLDGPTFAQIAAVPGAPASWGVPLAVFGALALIGSVLDGQRLVAVAFTFAAAWCAIFAWAFLAAVLDDSTGRAAVTGPWAYGALCLTYALLAAAHGQRRGAR